MFQYILSELGCEGTKGWKDQTNIKAIVTQSNLQKVLTKYINDYVRCPNCKSFNTIIKKDQSTRLYGNLLQKMQKWNNYTSYYIWC